MEVLLSLIGPKVLGALGGAITLLMALVGVYLKGRSTGKENERAKQAQATLDIVADDKEARESVEALPAAAAKSELGKWSRS